MVGGGVKNIRRRKNNAAAEKLSRAGAGGPKTRFFLKNFHSSENCRTVSKNTFSIS